MPFPPGGPADTAVRIAQAGMEKALGQPIVVENVAGAAGGIGAQRVKQAEPDGYTLLQAASPHTTNAAVKPRGQRRSAARLRADRPDRQQRLHAVRQQGARRSRRSPRSIARAKAKPGELKIGSVGIGSAHHLIAEMLKSAAGIELTHVPYRGEAPAIPDLVAGRIDLMFLTTAKPLIDDGRVVGSRPHRRRAVVPTCRSSSRSPSSACKDFVVPGWNGLMAPKGTPPAVVAKLSEALSAALSTEAAVTRLQRHGLQARRRHARPDERSRSRTTCGCSPP